MVTDSESPNTVVLHLSDIHFRHEDSNLQLYDTEADIRHELERDAAAMQTTLGPVRAIAVTGDIAFGGKPEEYERAARWLEALCTQLRCTEENVWTTPGNHDVDRSLLQSSDALQTLHRELRQEAAHSLDARLRRELKDPAKGPSFFHALAGYNAFATPYGCTTTIDRVCWSYDLQLNDGSILRLHGMNSTLISDESDDDAANKLLLGSFQVTLPRQEGVEYMTLCHHPPQWLRDEDAVDDLLIERARIQLFGHKHRQRLRLLDNSLRVSAGAFHPDQREPNWQPRYNLLGIRVEGGPTNRVLVVDVYPRVWDASSKWVADTGTDPAGRRSFRLHLPDWAPPQVQVPAAVPVADSSGGTVPAADDNVSVTDTSAPPEQRPLVDVNRRLAYRFLRLPYHRRVAVAQNLGLLADEDEGRPASELFQLFFQRARERRLLAELWSAVEKNHGNGHDQGNPFAGR